MDLSSVNWVFKMTKVCSEFIWGYLRSFKRFFVITFFCLVQIENLMPNIELLVDKTRIKKLWFWTNGRFETVVAWRERLIGSKLRKRRNTVNAWTNIRGFVPEFLTFSKFDHVMRNTRDVKIYFAGSRSLTTIFVRELIPRTRMAIFIKRFPEFEISERTIYFL